MSKISVGNGVLDVPKNELSRYGKIAEKYINNINDFYENLYVDRYKCIKMGRRLFLH